MLQERAAFRLRPNAQSALEVADAIALVGIVLIIYQDGHHNARQHRRTKLGISKSPPHEGEAARVAVLRVDRPLPGKIFQTVDDARRWLGEQMP